MGGIAQNSIIGLVLRGAGLLLNFVTFFLILKILDKVAFGEFVVLWSFAQLVAGLAKGGVEKLYVIKVSDGSVQFDTREEYELITKCAFSILLFWLGSTLILGCIYSYAYRFGFAAMCLMSASGLVLSFSTLIANYLRVRKKQIRAQILEGCLLPGLLLLVWAVIYVASLIENFDLDLIFYLALQTLVALLFFSICIFMSGASPMRTFSKKNISFELLQFFNTSSSRNFAVVSSVNILLSQVVFVVGGLFLSFSDFASYRVAFQFASLVLLPLPIVNLVAAPHLATFRALGSMESIRSAFIQIVVTSLGLSIPIFLFITIFATSLVGFYGGDEYLDAVPLVYILGTAALINVITGPVGLTLLTFGDEGFYASVAIAALVFIVVAVCWLSFSYGVLGAAIASALTTSLLNAILLIRVLYKHVHLRA